MLRTLQWLLIIFVASFSVLTAFWIIKTIQVKERSKEEKQRKEAVFVIVHCHFGRLYFVHRVKSPFKNPIFETGLELLTNQVPIVVYCHSYKELKMANFEPPAHASANFAPPAHASANFAPPVHASANFAPCIVHATLVRNLLYSTDSTWDLFFCIFWCKFLSYPCN